MPFEKAVERISQLRTDNLNEFEYLSILKSIELIKGQLEPEQRELLEHFKKPAKTNIPKEAREVKRIDPSRKLLFQLPNLLEETIPKQFTYQPKQGELFNRAKQKEDVSDLELQDHLSGLLAQQSKQLLENTKQFQTKIQQDTAGLSEMEYELENINLRVKSARDSMKLVGKKTWTTTILIWASILGLLIVFIWTFFFMRFVSVRK